MMSEQPSGNTRENVRNQLMLFHALLEMWGGREGGKWREFRSALISEGEGYIFFYKKERDVGSRK